MSDAAKITSRQVPIGGSYPESQTTSVGTGESQKVNNSNQKQAGGNAPAQAPTKKPHGEASARLSELNLNGQLQQMKMRELEDGGRKEYEIHKFRGGPGGGGDTPATEKSGVTGGGAEAVQARQPRRSHRRGKHPTVRSRTEAFEKKLKEKGLWNEKSFQDALNRQDVRLLKQYVKGHFPSVKSTFFDMAEKGNPKAIEALIEAGVSPNIRDQFGATPLMLAVSKDYTRERELTIRLLLPKGTQAKAEVVNAKDGKDWTVLMYARDVRTAGLLLDHGAKTTINAQDKKGMTALTVAVGLRNSTLVEQYLQNLADPNIKDENGRTALDYAIELQQLQPNDFERQNIVNKLRQRGARSGFDLP
jgi:hypothetical protein